MKRKTHCRTARTVSSSPIQTPLQVDCTDEDHDAVQSTNPTFEDGASALSDRALMIDGLDGADPEGDGAPAVREDRDPQDGGSQAGMASADGVGKISNDGEVSDGALEDSSSHGGTVDPDGVPPASDVEQVLKTADGKIIVVRKESKKGDGLTMGKLIVSGAAAVTASIITTRLAGTVNGLLIVGASSVIIAVLNEVYRRIFAKMKKISARAVVSMPLGKILPDKMARKVNDDLQSVLQDTTSSIPIIHEVDVDKTEEETLSSESKDLRSKVTPEDVSSAYRRSTEDGEDGEIVIPKLRVLIHESGFWRGLRRWGSIEWRSWSWITKSMVVVLSFTLLSAGVSVAMSSVLEQPEINVTNVTKHDVKDLTDEEKEAIKSAAVQAVQDQLDGIRSKQAELDGRLSNLESGSGGSTGGSTSTSPSPSASSSPSPSGSGEADVESLSKTVADLKTEIDSLRSSGAGGGSGSGGSTDTDAKSRIDALTSRMDALDARIAKIEAAGNGESSTGQGQSQSSGQTG